MCSLSRGDLDVYALDGYNVSTGSWLVGWFPPAAALLRYSPAGHLNHTCPLTKTVGSVPLSHKLQTTKEASFFVCFFYWCDAFAHRRN